MKTLVFDMVENIVGTGGKAGFPTFSFPTTFSKTFIHRAIKPQDYVAQS